MRLRRLLTMSVPELACRGRQETSKWLERLAVTGETIGQPRAIFLQIGWVPSQAGFDSRFQAGNLGKAAGMLLEEFKTEGGNRFFEGIVSDETPGLIAQQMREARNQAVVAAEKVCQRRFDLLGYYDLRFGDPIDWHLDPISGRRVPLVHWSRLNPLDRATVGDSKVIWELNRHQWLLGLGQAYRLTGDERYAEAFARYVEEWLPANPPGLGINWASSLEVALRLISWCWALFLFRQSTVLSPKLFVEMLGGIQAHASHVEKYLSYYFAPNTHLTGEALGLFYAGVVFPQLRSAGRWRELGMRILADQIQRQVLPDGVYFEQSMCYQRYTVEIYLHFLILARRNNIAIPMAVEERVHRMLDFFMAIRGIDGSIPQIGDADGGWLLPLHTRAPDDIRGIFSTAAGFFSRSDYAWVAGGVQPEVLWLLGTSGMSAFRALRPAPPVTDPSRLFPEGGYCVMRSGREETALQLIFDAGPLGCPMSGGHGHADLLSIQCSISGQPYLVDAGTCCYASDPAWREYFRSTSAHSTVTVDCAEQAVPAGSFRWQARPRAHLRYWLSTERFDFADAEHGAYQRLADPVTHRRRVVFVKPRYWIVVDDLQGSADHRIELRFQFAPMEVTVDPTLWARARGRREHGLLVRVFATVPLTAEVREGELAPIQGWISPNYGQRKPAPLLVYQTVARLPLRFMTLLLPTCDALASFPVVSLLAVADRGPVGLVFEDPPEVIRFGEQQEELVTLESVAAVSADQ